MEHKVKLKTKNGKAVVSIKLEFDTDELSTVFNSTRDLTFLSEKAFKRFASVDNYEGHVSSYLQHLAMFALEVSLTPKQRKVVSEYNKVVRGITKRKKKPKQRRTLTGV